MNEDETMHLPLDEGDECPDCHLGVMRYVVEHCTCHRGAPCWACVEVELSCDFCGGNA